MLPFMAQSGDQVRDQLNPEQINPTLKSSGLSIAD
jgi:hypothetical protein